MASISANFDFEVEEVSQRLKDAMDGIGTDKDAIISILAAYDNMQLQEVRTQYTSMFGQDLIDDLKSETRSYFEELCIALVRERTEFLVHLVNDAIKGAGTKEQILCDVFGTMRPWELYVLSDTYNTIIESKMEDDVTSDVGGNFGKMLIAIMAGGRSEDPEPDYELAEEDANKLYNAGEGTFGTDEGAFMSILMTRSYEHLKVVFETYEGMREEDDDRKTLLEAIQSEFSGSEEAILTTIVKFSLGESDYFADLLRECMEGIGTSERRLLYTIVRRAENDLLDIAEKYCEKHEEDLAERIKSEVNDDLGNLLANLVHGNQ